MRERKCFILGLLALSLGVILWVGNGYGLVDDMHVWAGCITGKRRSRLV